MSDDVIDDGNPDLSVVQLDSVAGIETAVADSNRVSLICFYTPQSQHCKDVVPFLADTVAAHPNKIACYKVDVSELTGNSYGISAVPLWRISFNGNTVAELAGGNTRKVAGLLQRGFAERDTELDRRRQEEEEAAAAAAEAEGEVDEGEEEYEEDEG
eukprot:TRINITY_DN1625_c0_g1_i1.p4 TRINITY_DN1625_c0_g1~~TRINITY_DN1625_c0_g1_i1.p4  ORF type:complete len:157 (+),score=19.28 TRINITY_DN1625_c0_g1_i1:240-710(+)